MYNVCLVGPPASESTEDYAEEHPSAPMGRRACPFDERTRSPAHRGGWMLLGMILGALGGWWAHKTDIIHKLIKIF